MEDFSIWDQISDFRVDEAAYLWCGMEPPPTGTYEPMLRVVEKVMHRILAAIQNGEFPSEEEGKTVRLDKPYELINFRLSRAALRRWAENQNDGFCPLFLFPEIRQQDPAKPLARHAQNPPPAIVEPSERKYENLLKTFGLLIRLYANKGGKKYRTADDPNVSQIAEDICQEAENLGLLEHSATGLRKTSVQEKIKEALQKLVSF